MEPEHNGERDVAFFKALSGNQSHNSHNVFKRIASFAMIIRVNDSLRGQHKNDLNKPSLKA